jgi:hypothetical protein
MASTTYVILGAAAALLVWTCVGVAVARAVLPQRTLHAPLAPAHLRCRSGLGGGTLTRRKDAPLGALPSLPKQPKI